LDELVVTAFKSSLILLHLIFAENVLTPDTVCVVSVVHRFALIAEVGMVELVMEAPDKTGALENVLIPAIV
jgi:hypothetical protein